VLGNDIIFIHTASVTSCFSFARLRFGSHFREFPERKLTNQVAR